MSAALLPQAACDWCNVSTELYAKQRKLVPPLVTRFGVIPRVYNEDLILTKPFFYNASTKATAGTFHLMAVF